MNVFISNATEDASTAEQIELSLRTLGHEIFRPGSQVDPGADHSSVVRAAIAGADIFIFLVSEASIEPGRYSLSELRMAMEKWPQPAGHVLPVVHGRVDIARVPAYLRAVTFLSPTGSVAAEVAAAVERIAATAGFPGFTARRRKLGTPLSVIATTLLVLLALVAMAFWLPEARSWLGYIAVGFVCAATAWALARRRPNEWSGVVSSRTPQQSREDSRDRSTAQIENSTSVAAKQVSLSQGLVFVSYARTDAAAVLPLAKQLRDRGVQVWVDQWDILSGADWDESIDRALRSCQLLLLHLSPRAIESREVRGEWMTALDQAKTILPVVLETCQIPRQLIAIQVADLRGHNESASAIDALADSINSHIASSNRVASPL